MEHNRAAILKRVKREVSEESVALTTYSSVSKTDTDGRQIRTSGRARRQPDRYVAPDMKPVRQAVNMNEWKPNPKRADTVQRIRPTFPWKKVKIEVEEEPDVDEPLLPQTGRLIRPQDEHPPKVKKVKIEEIEIQSVPSNRRSNEDFQREQEKLLRGMKHSAALNRMAQDILSPSRRGIAPKDGLPKTSLPAIMDEENKELQEPVHFEYLLRQEEVDREMMGPQERETPVKDTAEQKKMESKTLEEWEMMDSEGEVLPKTSLPASMDEENKELQEPVHFEYLLRQEEVDREMMGPQERETPVKDTAEQKQTKNKLAGKTLEEWEEMMDDSEDEVDLEGDDEKEPKQITGAKDEKDAVSVIPLLFREFCEHQHKVVDRSVLENFKKCVDEIYGDFNHLLNTDGQSQAESLAANQGPSRSRDNEQDHDNLSGEGNDRTSSSDMESESMEDIANGSSDPNSDVEHEMSREEKVLRDQLQSAQKKLVDLQTSMKFKIDDCWQQMKNDFAYRQTAQQLDEADKEIFRIGQLTFQKKKTPTDEQMDALEFAINRRDDIARQHYGETYHSFP